MLNRPEDTNTTPAIPTVRFYPHEVRRFFILGILIVVIVIFALLLLAGGIQDTVLHLFIGA